MRRDAAAGDTATYYEDSDPVQDFIARAGAWAVHSSGSPTKVGEYQNLSPRPSGTSTASWSNGEPNRRLQRHGSDNETNDGRLHYFGPHVEADLDYERFQHQLDAHDSIRAGTSTVNNRPGRNSHQPANRRPQHRLFTDNNLIPGQDFAIRVQECKANFKGNITENLKWRVNVFGIDKEGERQVNAFQHCSAAPATIQRADCHQYPAARSSNFGTAHSAADVTAASAT